MAEWDYSVDALNAKSAFYGAKAIIYVEGDDDVLFWQEVFSRVSDADFEIEAAGGSDQIDKYIAQIDSGQLHAIAARDADFLRLCGNVSNDPRVIYTAGYSIENTLYTVEAIAHLARIWCKTTRVSMVECEKWMLELSDSIAPLVHLDAANAISNSGATTIGDNCARFMKSQTSAILCSAKVAAKVAEARVKLPEESVALAKAAVGDTHVLVISHLRGHFLATAVLKFIVAKAKQLGRKINVSADSLYAAAVTHFGKTLGNKHPHQDHYLLAAKAAWVAL